MTWLIMPGSSFTSLRMRSIIASLPWGAAEAMGGGGGALEAAPLDCRGR